MGRLFFELRVYVLETQGAQFKHLISDRVGRTWCNRVDYKQAASIVGLYEVTGGELAGHVRDEICPRCLQYWDWLALNTVPLVN